MSECSPSSPPRLLPPAGAPADASVLSKALSVLTASGPVIDRDVLAHPPSVDAGWMAEFDRLAKGLCAVFQERLLAFDPWFLRMQAAGLLDRFVPAAERFAALARLSDENCIRAFHCLLEEEFPGFPPCAGQIFSSVNPALSIITTFCMPPIFILRQGELLCDSRCILFVSPAVSSTLGWTWEKLRNMNVGVPYLYDLHDFASIVPHMLHGYLEIMAATAPQPQARFPVGHGECVQSHYVLSNMRKIGTFKRVKLLGGDGSWRLADVTVWVLVGPRSGLPLLNLISYDVAAPGQALSGVQNPWLASSAAANRIS